MLRLCAWSLHLHARSVYACEPHHIFAHPPAPLVGRRGFLGVVSPSLAAGCLRPPPSGAPPALG
eukprot:7907804-Alexandrium_andersonii.AAC.1